MLLLFISCLCLFLLPALSFGQTLTIPTSLDPATLTSTMLTSYSGYATALIALVVFVVTLAVFVRLLHRPVHTIGRGR